MYAKKACIVALCMLFIVGALFGCASNGPTPTAAQTTSQASVQPSTAAPSAPVSEGISFPLKAPITLKYWLAFSSTYIKTLADNKFYQDLEKKTNIHIDWIHPPQGQETEQYNIMIASSDLPDIICWSTYPGGLDKAISDGVYVKLNDYIDKYAPNYKRVINSNPEIKRQTMTDSGNIAQFYLIQTAEEPAWDGLIVRGDWLTELGLQAPKTIDDWHNMLTLFKQKKNAESPLLFSFDWQLAYCAPFMSAYNVIADFYNENGTIKYGPIESGYKDFLSTMNQWYKEGLLDKDFATRDGNGQNAYFTSGKSGAMLASYGGFGGMDTAGKAIDSKFTILGVPEVSLNAGDQTHFRCTNNFNKGSETAITTANKHIPETVAMLDLGFVEDNFPTYNYGIEGISWNWKSGALPGIDKPFWPTSMQNLDKHPEYNDFMLHNPDGTAFWDLVNAYKPFYLPYLRDPMAYGGMEGDVTQAMNSWTSTGNDWMLPPLSNTDVENQEITPIMNDVNTYVNEMEMKFVMGVEPLTNFDQYVSQIKSMGIDKVIKDKQAAYERYQSRK